MEHWRDVVARGGEIRNGEGGEEADHAPGLARLGLDGAYGVRETSHLAARLVEELVWKPPNTDRPWMPLSRMCTYG